MTKCNLISRNGKTQATASGLSRSRMALGTGLVGLVVMARLKRAV